VAENVAWLYVTMCNTVTPEILQAGTCSNDIRYLDFASSPPGRFATWTIRPGAKRPGGVARIGRNVQAANWQNGESP